MTAPRTCCSGAGSRASLERRLRFRCGCGANRSQVSNMSSSTSRTRLPDGLAGPCFLVERCGSIAFQAARALTIEFALRRPMRRRPPARASFSTSSKGRTPAAIRWARRSAIGDAGQFERRLVLPEAERRAVRPAEQRAISARAASACRRRPGRRARRRRLPGSPCRARRAGETAPPSSAPTSPPMTVAPAIRPRSPAILTSASVSQVATSRSLEFAFKAPDRQRGDRPPKRRQALVATGRCRGFGLPLGVARAGARVAKTEVDRVRRVVFAKIGPGRLLAGKRCQDRLEVGCLKFRNHCEGTRRTGPL